MSQFNLPLPQQDAVLAMSDPDICSEWLLALPYGQPLACARLLLEHLDQHCQSRIELAKRLGLRAQYKQAVEHLLPALRIDLRHRDEAVPPRARQSRQLAQQLCSALHHLDKLIVVERYASSWLFSRYRSKLSLVTTALESARELANAGARDYLLLPQGFWHDCHQLWMLACEEDPQEELECKHTNSAAVIYRQILLLGMTATNRFSSHEHESLLAMIRKYAPLLALHPYAGNEQSAYLFHPEQDKPPRFLADTKAVSPASGWWHADCNAILPLLQERLATLTRMFFAQQSQETAEERLLTKRLQQQWRQPASRRSPRYQQQQQILLVSQMHACWFAANPDGWQVTLPDAEQAVVSDQAAVMTPAAPASYELVNFSSQGVLLRGISTAHAIRCGELVMLHFPERGWQPGLIRWLNVVQHGALLEFGVEFIARQATAVMTLPVITFAQDQPQPALLLPAIDALDQPTLLLLSGRQYEDLREFNLYTPQGTQRIRLTHLEQQTGFYQLAEFRIEPGS